MRRSRGASVTIGPLRGLLPVAVFAANAAAMTVTPTATFAAVGPESCALLAGPPERIRERWP